MVRYKRKEHFFLKNVVGYKRKRLNMTYISLRGKFSSRLGLDISARENFGKKSWLDINERKKVPLALISNHQCSLFRNYL